MSSLHGYDVDIFCHPDMGQIVPYIELFGVSLPQVPGCSRALYQAWCSVRGGRCGAVSAVSAALHRDYVAQIAQGQQKIRERYARKGAHEKCTQKGSIDFRHKSAPIRLHFCDTPLYARVPPHHQLGSQAFENFFHVKGICNLRINLLLQSLEAKDILSSVRLLSTLVSDRFVSDSMFFYYLR
jgi:hypothetical protein